MNYRLLLFAASFGIIAAACNNNAVFEKNQPLEKEQWEYANVQKFDVEITDTTAKYNLYVNVRHSFKFEWRNMWVNITTQFPDSTKFNKRVNLLLSEADGRWFGDCLYDNCDISIPIQQNALFPKAGTYHFTIAQDMRINPLDKVKSVGFKVEKATNQKQQ